MKIKIYVNYMSKELLTKKQYSELIEKRWDNFRKDEENFSFWLNNRYKALDIFTDAMAGIDGIKILDQIKKDYEDEMYKYVKFKLGTYENWEEVELEV